MSAVHELRYLYEVNDLKFSWKEACLLEAAFFTALCEQLMQLIKESYENYYKLIKFDTEKESEMLEENFIRCLINDLVASGEYSLIGIAQYTNIPEEVVYDLALGKNVNPSLVLARRIIELHKIVRRDLYHGLLKKFLSETYHS